MIVQCDQCSAKFRLDDSKVKEGGVKVRCSKCKSIFVVQKETPPEEVDFDSLLNGLVPPSPEASEMPGEAIPPGAGQFAPEEGQLSETELPGPGKPEPGVPPEKEGFDFGEFNFDEGEFGAAPAPPLGEEEKGGLDFGELDLENGDSAKGSATGEQSFDDAAFPFPEEPVPPAPEIEINIEGIEGPGGGGEAWDKDFSAPSFEFSFEPEAGEPEASPPASEPEEKGNEPPPLEFGELEFGEAPPVEKPEKEEVALPEPEGWGLEKMEALPREPEDWEWEKPGTPAHEQVAVPHIPDMPMAEEELPPLSISSRRKGGSILPIAVTAVSVLLVVALAAGGYYFFKEGPSAFDKVGLGFVAKWLGLEAREEGSIGIGNPIGAFLNNKEAGEIFVINGEAINNFTKPRASIQVKATLYGPKGEVLVQKTAYCGNAISRDQLTTLPVAKLEAAMANQFGDSLSNLAVQPGKGIPFVVVFTNVPKETAEFGVEVAGSTVASQ